ncbi:MAG: DNA-binding response regulator [Rheinheimera sp.]|uniref:LytR/AlgR family response regulator transcription factor n=1 Tax=Arsukibacterium sp. UBA3155 TaxID=1946058 RepID=UPI000C8ECBC5|nr:LytTR family DNA-binding domain-containing protein [Arsukibacterium sp. UBA3155]MAD75849.1 DNA-binding response regulator [Rheinheimera sp.]|tara:strand:+ start:5725 stop:6423 length:699 start_codon:yes stop_codon:yes gene_type:complete
MDVLVVDDSRLARLELVEQLNQISGTTLVGEAANISQAKQLVQSLKPDVMLLDINMPGGDGFKLLEQLDYLPQVIFVTAYDHYAIKSFEYNALDYLLKPVTLKRLQSAFDKLKPVSQNEQKLALHQQIFIKDGDNCFFVTLADVICFEAMGNYTRVHLANAAPATYRSISAIAERLPAESFFRASRSWIINTHYIKEITPSVAGGFDVQLQHDKQVEISRRQASAFRQHWSL